MMIPKQLCEWLVYVVALTARLTRTHAGPELQRSLTLAYINSSRGTADTVQHLILVRLFFIAIFASDGLYTLLHTTAYLSMEPCLHCTYRDRPLRAAPEDVAAAFAILKCSELSLPDPPLAARFDQLKSFLDQWTDEVLQASVMRHTKHQEYTLRHSVCERLRVKSRPSSESNPADHGLQLPVQTIEDQHGSFVGLPLGLGLVWAAPSFLPMGMALSRRHESRLAILGCSCLEFVGCERCQDCAQIFLCKNVMGSEQPYATCRRAATW